MEDSGPIRCRIAACPEALEDGKQWSFYLINDSANPLDLAVLEKVAFEWGDWVSNETADARITDLQPGAAALLWRGDDSGAELRMDMSVLVHMRGREVRLLFEFPMLYRKQNLQVVDGLGKPGWQETAGA
jgi:hypothetical protein